MSQISDLHRLIQTLNKNEKKLFTVRISHQTKSATRYIKLFDDLAAITTWEEATTLEQLQMRWGKQQLVHCAKGLYSWLLRILEDTYRETTMQQFYHRILQVELLFERQLYTQAFAILQEIKQEAQTLQLFTILILVHDWELVFLKNHNYAFPDMEQEADMEQFLAEGQQNIARLDNLLMYRQQLFRLGYQMNKKHSEAAREEIRQTMQQPAFTAIEHAQSIPAQLYFYHIQCFNASFQRQYDQLLEWAIAQWNFVQMLPACHQYYHNTALGAYNNILVGAMGAEQWAIFDQYAQHAPVDLAQYIPNFAAYLEEIVIYKELVMLVKTNEIEQAWERIPVYTALLQAQGTYQLSPHRLERFHYWMALLCYEKQAYMQAADFLRPYIQHGAMPHSELQIAAQMLWLSIHYEQGEYYYIQRSYRTFYRWFSRHSNYSKIEQFFLSFFRKATQPGTDGAVLRDVLQQIATRFAAIRSKMTVYERTLYYYFPLDRWLNRQYNRL